MTGDDGDGRFARIEKEPATQREASPAVGERAACAVSVLDQAGLLESRPVLTLGDLCRRSNPLHHVKIGNYRRMPASCRPLGRGPAGRPRATYSTCRIGPSVRPELSRCRDAHPPNLTGAWCARDLPPFVQLRDGGDVSEECGSAAEERSLRAASMHHAENKLIFVLDTVHNHVFAHGQAAVAGAEISLTRAPDLTEAEGYRNDPPG